jgi:YihY family inner membrane protein
VPAPAGQKHRPPLRAFKDFWIKAYQDNVTGLAGMVAYNLLLSVFPLALLALFIAGRVLESPDLEASVLSDLQQLFPNATDATLTRALARIRDSSTGFGVFALVASVWIGSSFWGALDTAFGEIYHVESRSWLRQKWFSFGMLAVVLLFMAATVAVPTLQSLLTTGTEDLPLGLSDVNGLIFAVSLVAGLVLLFAVVSLIYWAVPNHRMPWRAIWPGALAATVAIGVVDYAFPVYLGSISTIARFGTTFVFVLIVLLWFYALAMILLSGAIINALRFELHDTGKLDTPA